MTLSDSNILEVEAEGLEDENGMGLVSLLISKSDLATEILITADELRALIEACDTGGDEDVVVRNIDPSHVVIRSVDGSK